MFMCSSKDRNPSFTGGGLALVALVILTGTLANAESDHGVTVETTLNPALAGDQVIYTFTVTNAGPDADSPVQLDVYLPAFGLSEPPPKYDGDPPWGDEYEWEVSAGATTNLYASSDGDWLFQTDFGQLDPSESGWIEFPVTLATLPPAESILTVNSPPSVAGDIEHRPGSWGLGFFLEGEEEYDIAGDLELVDNGAGGSDGCTIPVGFTVGNIALIDRGSCEFGAKGLNAELAGATAVIIANNIPEQPLYGPDGIHMGGGDLGASVKIPVTIVHYDDGVALKAALLAKAVVDTNLYSNFDLSSWEIGVYAVVYTQPDLTNPNDPNPENDEVTDLLTVYHPVLLFADDFESGDTSNWAVTVP